MTIVEWTPINNLKQYSMNLQSTDLTTAIVSAGNKAQLVFIY